MKKLVVNADDYGFTVGVNRGIIEGHQEGIITSATIMAMGAALADGIARLKDAPRLGLGCHLVVIGEKPVLPAARVPSLVDSAGNFPRTLTQFLMLMSSGRVRHQEIVDEFRAQLDRLINAGLEISHCDSHKHSHAHPRVLDAVIQVAEEYRINYIRRPFEQSRLMRLMRLYRDGLAEAGRRFLLSKMLGYYQMLFQRRMRRTMVRCPDHFRGFIATGSLSPELMPALLAEVPEGVTELMCHPARLDAELQMATTKLKESRELELAALTCAQARTAIRTEGIQLTSFRELAQELS
jgi:chitin disaccharide deacetylase